MKASSVILIFLASKIITVIVTCIVIYFAWNMALAEIFESIRAITFLEAILLKILYLGFTFSLNERADFQHKR